jgi:S1-C subfamily serine protease
MSNVILQPENNNNNDNSNNNNNNNREGMVTEGIIVSKVMVGGPAHSKGLKAHDQIVKVSDKELSYRTF